MTEQRSRPDPDRLLDAVRSQDQKALKGRLKVFLGMCPGVGKTYAMLRAAQQERAAGRTVIVGVVETHGRAETADMLAGLEVHPPKTFPYRGTEIQEFDLEGLLARRPELALIDELAHTNAPGARHGKRWQDVMDLLEAGIDVFTTLNVQHIESRADAVRQISGATVQETVPDSLLDLADEVELVDLTPEGLLDRLRDGKVYLGERGRLAAEGFFREEKLNALREIALRYTAERVDRQLRGLRRAFFPSVVWRSGERLLVAVGPSPFSTQLVRWTRRLAAAQGAPWLAVHVEGAGTLTAEAQALLDRNLALARELGAELVLTRSDDIAQALVRVALEHNATQIVVGKPRWSHWFDWIRGGNLVDRLIRLGGNIDIYVVPAERETKRPSWWTFDPLPRSGWSEYAWAGGMVSAVTAVGWLLPGEYYLASGLLYLLGIVALSLRVGRWPVLAAGIVSALIWNFFFIPPRFTFQINRLEDATLFGTYFVVALILGQLTARIRSQALNERQREQRATAMFHLTRALAAARDLDEAVFAALRQVDQLFAAQSTVLLVENDGTSLHPHFAASYAVDEKERAVAMWSQAHRRPAGRFTTTLPGCQGYYVPIVREERVLGVLGVVVAREATLTLAQRDLLEGFARSLGLILEREELRAVQAREKLLAESEKLHRALFDSVSHELRTPLAVLTGALETMADGTDERVRGTLIEEGRKAARRLNRLVGNLLDQTRLESGALRPRLDWCDARDLVNSAVAAVADGWSDRFLEISIPDDLPPIRADFALMEQALANLLFNATVHTPMGTPISIAVGLDRKGTRIFFTIADRGPGFPPEMKQRLFQKFSRGDAAKAGGLGLGLSIVRGFVTAQAGEIVLGENPGGGSVFTIYLPHVTPQPADEV